MAALWKVMWGPLRTSLQLFRGKLIGMGMFLPRSIAWYIVRYRLRPQKNAIYLYFILVNFPLGVCVCVSLSHFASVA